MKKIEIDANNRTIGRVATEAAMALMGKNTATYRPNIAPDVKVVIINASQTKITAQRNLGKVYTTYTGHPGGLRKEMLRDLIQRRGIEEVYRRAVKGMLPKNRLQKIFMSNLLISE